MKRKILTVLLFVLVGIPTNLLSQNKWISPDYIKDGIPFMMSLNPCGLISMDTLNISDISLLFNKNNGGLVNYSQSNDDFRITLDANSIYRFNKKIVLRGAIDYSYYQGLNMSGSAFMQPYYKPFDICEFDDVNKGTKNLEQYHILAELGYNIYKDLILGASFDLVSANYSKMKDLRHSNTFSNIQLDLALAYSFQDVVSIGASYHYRKNIEGIYFKRYSISDHLYSLLVSYGTFWGKRKTYDETTGMITQSKTPMIDRYHGTSFQVNIKPSEKFTLFFEGVYRSRFGSYGIKSPKSVQYYSHNGRDCEASVTGVIQPGNSRHIISFQYSNKSVSNYESLYKIGITATGATQVSYFDPVFTGKTQFSEYGIRYRADWDIVGKMPLWTVTLDAGVYGRKRIGVLYPFYRNDDLMLFNAMIQAEKKFIVKSDNLFSVNLSVGYIDGLKSKMQDGSYIPNPSQSAPRIADLMQGRELEFLTSTQVIVAPLFRYSKQFKKVIAYVGAGYAYHKALDAVKFLQGNDLHTFNIFIGIII